MTPTDVRKINRVVPLIVALQLRIPLLLVRMVGIRHSVPFEVRTRRDAFSSGRHSVRRPLRSSDNKERLFNWLAKVPLVASSPAPHLMPDPPRRFQPHRPPTLSAARRKLGHSAILGRLGPTRRH